MRVVNEIRDISQPPPPPPPDSIETESIAIELEIESIKEILSLYNQSPDDGWDDEIKTSTAELI